MHELIKVEQSESGNPTVSARNLHEFLEVGTEFRHWFPRMCEYGFVNNQDYTPVIFDHPQNGQPTTDYCMTVEMAKEISMLQRTEKGKEARTYFIEVEKAWNSPERLMARALVVAQNTIKMLAPKAEFFDQVASSKDAISMQQVAKVLNIPKLGRNKLFKLLREKGILDDNNIPYQEFCDRGYFRVIEQKYTDKKCEQHIAFRTLVYQRGLDYIRRLAQEVA